MGDGPAGWAFQPGWSQGQLVDQPPVEHVRSMSIALPPQRFWPAVARLLQADVRSLRAEPFWVGYWSFVVRDPDGRTLELSDRVRPEIATDGPPAAR